MVWITGKESNDDDCCCCFSWRGWECERHLPVCELPLEAPVRGPADNKNPGRQQTCGYWRARYERAALFDFDKTQSGSQVIGRSRCRFARTGYRTSLCFLWQSIKKIAQRRESLILTLPRPACPAWRTSPAFQSQCPTRAKRNRRTIMNLVVINVVFNEGSKVIYGRFCWGKDAAQCVFSFSTSVKKTECCCVVGWKGLILFIFIITILYYRMLYHIS